MGQIVFLPNCHGAPEMFGQRTTSGYPQFMDPMHVPGSSGEYVEDRQNKLDRLDG